MNRKVLASAWALYLVLFSCAAQIQPGATDKIPWIGKEQLLAILDDPGLILLDARYKKDWSRSDLKIRNAERLDASEIDSWEGRYPSEQRIIIYCA